MNKNNKKPNSDSLNNEQYNAVDIFKFICAILVCTIHVRPFPNYMFNNAHVVNYFIANGLARIAVPFFFTAAGFFLFKKIDLNHIDTTIVKEYCFKILRLLGIWSVLSFYGGKEQLWYLGAMVIAILITTYLLKKGLKLKYIFIIFLILYFIGMVGDNYYTLAITLRKNQVLRIIMTNYELYFRNTRNGLFFAPIFIIIGAVLATKKIKINLKLAYFAMILSLFSLTIEVTLLYKYSCPQGYNMYIAMLPLIFFTFYLLINIKLKDRPVYKRLRIISILFYFLHCLVYHLLKMSIHFIKVKTHINLNNYCFIFVVIITIAISLLIEKLSRKKKFKFLRYLYS